MIKPSFTLSLTLWLVVAQAAVAGEVVRFNCREGFALPQGTTLRDAIDEKLRLYNLDSFLRVAFASGHTLDEVKSHFEAHLIVFAARVHQKIAGAEGRIVSAVEFKNLVSAREQMRFLRPYLDLRIREIAQEKKGAGPTQLHDLLKRQKKLRDAVQRYAAWAETKTVTINWSAK